MVDLFLNEPALVRLFDNVQGNLGEIQETISIIERINTSQCCAFIRHSAIYSLPVGVSNFSQLVFAQYQNNRDLILQLQRAIDRGQVIGDVDDPPLSGIDLLQQAKAGMIITADKLNHLSWWNKDAMYELRAASEVSASIRHVFLGMGLDEKAFSLFIEEMFPDLYFVEKPEAGKMGLNYRERIADIIRNLGWLNDQGNAAFSEYSQSEFIARAAAKNVVISPESTRSHKDKAAVRERTILIAGKSLYCEWHSKIEGQAGRIHFYPYRTGLDPAIEEITGKRLIIGVVGEHLK